MKLLALRCPQCGQKLEPKQNDVVVVVCAHCFTAVTLHQTGLQPIDVHYAAPAQERVDGWLPFWLFHGRVHMQQRESQGGSKGADKDAAKLWQQVQRLYAPAWNQPAPQAREIGSHLVQSQPLFQAIPHPDGALLSETVLTPEDGLKLLDFIVLTIEAERKDMLRDLKFNIEAGTPALWAIPAQKKGDGWQLVARV
ncbi:MAG: hypothetical protein HC804_14900 [Anaerolineae bacterium]|nr:hypothetical protein [Anaerolineae bacterium]